MITVQATIPGRPTRVPVTASSLIEACEHAEALGAVMVETRCCSLIWTSTGWQHYGHFPKAIPR